MKIFFFFEGNIEFFFLTLQGAYWGFNRSSEFEFEVHVHVYGNVSEKKTKKVPFKFFMSTTGGGDNGTLNAKVDNNTQCQMSYAHFDKKYHLK